MFPPTFHFTLTFKRVILVLQVNQEAFPPSAASSLFIHPKNTGYHYSNKVTPIVKTTDRRNKGGPLGHKIGALTAK
jgi:hypothetical protein